MKPRNLRGRFTPRETPRDACTIEGCEGAQVGRGLCKKHYLRLRKYGDTNLRRIISPTGVKCSVDGCDAPSRDRGMCHKHGHRARKNGDPNVVTTRMPTTPEARFHKLYLINKDTECWEWIGGHHEKGYGNFWHNGAMRTAHRVAYEILVGPVPEGSFVLHHCDNPPCVNPDHLFLGTHQDNMEDMRVKGRSTSEKRPHGSNHQFSKLNETNVAEIKVRLAKGEPCSDIAKDFAVDRTLISAIKRKKIWTHVRDNNGV